MCCRRRYFINANSATAPGIVDADRQEIIDRSEVYSGVYGRASINLYAFNSKNLLATPNTHFQIAASPQPQKKIVIPSNVPLIEASIN